ncbi:MAG: SET domain-containing protein [Xanthobacteraceae bacterium]|uniref:SET domain-containing protein n=1 Tax=Pseudolabrys sp. TaxID=1960880 RepID=UPI003D134DCB
MTDIKPFRVGRSRTGLGLFATRDIARDTDIVEYKGRRIETTKAKELEWVRPNRYLFEINSRWTIDGASRRNLARYVNHACRPNAEAVLTGGRMVYRATKRIREGDEITVDYGKEYFNLYLKPIGCLCLSCIEKRRETRRLARKRAARRASKSLQSKRRAKTIRKTKARRKTARRT